MKEFDYDMISRYLDGEMNTEEQKVFEAQMEGDAELRQQVDLYRDVNATLKMNLHPDAGELALHHTLNDLRPQYFSGRKGKLVSFSAKFRLIAAAAVIVAFISIAITYLYSDRKGLYEEYAPTHMPAAEERGIANDTLLKRVTENFNNRNFASALPLFDSILKTDPQNSFVQFYHALALLQNNDVQRSRKELLQLYNGNSIFHYDAAFYVALCYLKEKNKGSCREWLNKIPPGASAYGKAQEILNKL